MGQAWGPLSPGSTERSSHQCNSSPSSPEESFPTWGSVTEACIEESTCPTSPSCPEGSLQAYRAVEFRPREETKHAPSNSCRKEEGDLLSKWNNVTEGLTRSPDVYPHLALEMGLPTYPEPCRNRHMRGLDVQYHRDALRSPLPLL